MKPRRILLASILAATVAVAGCRTAPLMNVQEEPYGLSGSVAPARLALDDYGKAIVRAGAKRGWVFREIGPGHLEGTVTVRGKHEATVDIFYGTDNFSIIHKSSKNLNFDPSRNAIHPNYNSWVSLLEQEIRTEVQTMRAT